MSTTILDQLVSSAQHGDQDAVLTLWELVEGTARTVAGHYHGAAYISSDDLLQQAFLALLEAVRAYDSSRGDFRTIFIYYAKRLCGRALNLHRKTIEEAYSLDQPAGDDGDVSIAELVEDETLVPAQEQLEAGELSDILRTALDTLPERWRTVLIERYVYGRTLKAAGERLGCSYQNAARLEQCALKRLRENTELIRYYQGL